MRNVNPAAELDAEARVQQMKINARLVSLETAMKLMNTSGYLGVAGERKKEGEVFGSAVWIHQPGAVDNITLIAMAQEIESYILGNIEEETKAALENAAKKLNAPKIVRP